MVVPRGPNKAKGRFKEFLPSHNRYSSHYPYFRACSNIFELFVFKVFCWPASLIVIHALYLSLRLYTVLPSKKCPPTTLSVRLAKPTFLEPAAMLR